MDVASNQQEVPMRTRVSLAILLVTLAGVLPDQVFSQATLQPAAPPVVTADSEPWYVAAEPITYVGSVYFPTGPVVFFDPNDMVRSGDYRGIPLYARRTLEPFSVVFVPLSGGLMRPYERRREGDLAGMVGSSVPSFPIERSGERTYQAEPIVSSLEQAAAPPTGAVPLAGTEEGVPVGAIGEAAAPAPPSGTVGSIVTRPIILGPLASAKKPHGLNGVFIEYRNRRWFSSGPAVEFDAGRFVRVGEYHGFPVFAEPGHETERIFVAIARGVSGLVAPYALKREPQGR
jgi:hypothetical protein